MSFMYNTPLKYFQVDTRRCKKSTDPIPDTENGGLNLWITKWYVALGNEGNHILFDGVSNTLDLRGQSIVAVNRENYELRETASTPSNKEYRFLTGTGDLQFSTELEFGEQIKIIHTQAAVTWKTYWYLASGSEGSAILFDGVSTAIDLTLKNVIAVNRENYELKPSSGAPSNKEYGWNLVTNGELTLSTDLENGEQVKIIYI